MNRGADDIDALVVGALAAIGPTTACALAAWLRERGDGMLEAQVYRVLRRLIGRAQARLVLLDRRYVAASPGEPPTIALVCRACGGLTLVRAIETHARLRARAAMQMFRTEAAIIEVLGLCAGCPGVSSSPDGKRGAR